MDETENQTLSKEIRELNSHLKELRSSGKYLIYSANPFKFGLFNFLAGIFHALGTFVAYGLVFGVAAYFLSQFDFAGLMSRFLENSLDQVQWDKVVPQYQLPENLNLKGLN